LRGVTPQRGAWSSIRIRDFSSFQEPASDSRFYGLPKWPAGADLAAPSNL